MLPLRFGQEGPWTIALAVLVVLILRGSCLRHLAAIQTSEFFEVRFAHWQRRQSAFPAKMLDESPSAMVASPRFRSGVDSKRRVEAALPISMKLDRLGLYGVLDNP